MHCTRTWWYMFMHCTRTWWYMFMHCTRTCAAYVHVLGLGNWCPLQEKKIKCHLGCLAQEVESLQQSVIELKAKLHHTSSQLEAAEREKSSEVDKVLQLCNSVQQLTRYSISTAAMHVYILIPPPSYACLQLLARKLFMVIDTLCPCTCMLTSYFSAWRKARSKSSLPLPLTLSFAERKTSLVDCSALPELLSVR